MLYFKEAYTYKDKKNRVIFEVLKGEAVKLISDHQNMVTVQNYAKQKAAVPAEMVTDNKETIEFTKVHITPPEPETMPASRTTAPQKRPVSKVKKIGAGRLF